MSKTKLAVAGALVLISGCLLAQKAEPVRRRAPAGGASPSNFKIEYVQTNQTKNDWEQINFEFNSAILTDGFPTLLWLSDYLKTHPDYRVRIQGYTDAVGSGRYNKVLGKARADSIAAFLEKYGAAPNQIEPIGEGDVSPEATNKTAPGRWVNRRAVLTVTDPQGRQMSLEDLIRSTIPPAPAAAAAAEPGCCSEILKRLDKLDDILAELRRLRAEHDALESKVQGLENQLAGAPKPLTSEQTSNIAKTEATAAANQAVEDLTKRNKKFSLLGLNIGPTYGDGRTGDFTFSGKGRFFSPFGASGTHAVQAEAEYMYYPGRQEGQFDLGILNRWNRLQAGLFSSFKYVNWSEFNQGGVLGQGALTVDYIFSRGRVGVFGTKGFKDNPVVGQTQLGPNSFLETYMHIVDQVGASGQVGIFGNNYLEGNIGYLSSRSSQVASRPGGRLKLVTPISDRFALTAEVGLNETFLNTKQSGRVVFGFEFGNWLRPKEYLTFNHPVPADIPRVRYELLTRRVGNSAPVADAGADQIGVPAGTVILDASGSYDPDGDSLSYQWQQTGGPSVPITGMNSAKASFTAADGQTYIFRVTVTDTGGLKSTARTTVTTIKTPEIRIVQFSATPDVVTAGQSATLQWNVENADTVTISPQVGTVRSAGTATVAPGQTTQYTLTARANGRETTANVTIRVNPLGPSNPEVIRFEAAPSTIQPGQSATLSWTTQGAQSVRIAGVGENLPLNGSRVVSPTSTTTYTLVAVGRDGREVSAPAVVTVTAGKVPTVQSLTVAPNTIEAGGTAQLCWQVDGATTVTIAPGIGGVKTTDCVSVSPASSTTYVLTATNASGSVNASATLTVGGVRVVSFSSNPDYSSAAGAPVVLSWTTQNTVSVTITGTGAPGGNLPANGSVTVNPITNTDYTLTAYGAGGQTVTSVLHVFVR